MALLGSDCSYQVLLLRCACQEPGGFDMAEARGQSLNRFVFGSDDSEMIFAVAEGLGVAAALLEEAVIPVLELVAVRAAMAAMAGTAVVLAGAVRSASDQLCIRIRSAHMMPFILDLVEFRGYL